MKFLSIEKLSEHKYKTPEGYLVCVDSVLARTGKQTYRRCDVFGDACDNAEEEIEVDRPEDEVFNDVTLASFENKPLTCEHPDEDVNVSNYKEYSVGIVRDIKRGVDNGQPVMLGTLVFTDEETIKKIESGEMTELSCGYDCDIIDENNPAQRNIRGNHVALCERGRAGIARIVDSEIVHDKNIEDTQMKIPAGYKHHDGVYEVEFYCHCKDLYDLFRKFKAKYPEIYNIWLDEDMISLGLIKEKNGSFDYIDNQLRPLDEDGYSVYITMDGFDGKKYFGAIVIKEKIHRYVKDAIDDATLKDFEVHYLDSWGDDVKVLIKAKDKNEAIRKFRYDYGGYTIVSITERTVKQDSVNDEEEIVIKNNMPTESYGKTYQVYMNGRYLESYGNLEIAKQKTRIWIKQDEYERSIGYTNPLPKYEIRIKSRKRDSVNDENIILHFLRKYHFVEKWYEKPNPVKFVYEGAGDFGFVVENLKKSIGSAISYVDQPNEAIYIEKRYFAKDSIDDAINKKSFKFIVGDSIKQVELNIEAKDFDDALKIALSKIKHWSDAKILRAKRIKK